jgi:hypothetical protein
MKQGRCAEKYCKRKTNGTKICSTCRSRKSRQKNPVKYCYNNLKHNAKRRGIEFALTLEEFIQFCHETNYLAGKGRTKASYSIDRIDNNKGYTLDNIRVITLSENSKKGNKKLEYDWRTKTATVTKDIVINTNVDNYF